jgi:hypothetical protein
MNGMSRNKFILSKLIFVFILSFVSALILLLSGFVLGFTYTDELTYIMIIEKAIFIPAYFLEVFTFNMLAMLIAFILQRSVLSIGALALYSYILEPIMAGVFPASIGKYLPVESMGNLIDVPNTAIMKMFGVSFRENVSMPDMIVCAIYCCIFTILILVLYKRKDL